MQKIKLGPAGSPMASTFDGIAEVKRLGLQALEVQFTHGVRMSLDLAKQVGEESKKHGIRLSIHGPYYINLLSEDPQKIKDSKKRILDSCERGHFFGSKEDPTSVVFHPAYYGKLSKETAFSIVLNEIEEMNEILKENKWNSVLCPETSGKHSAFGTLDEIIEISIKSKSHLCVDLAHLYAKGMGKIDFSEVLNKLKKIKHPIHFQFSGINYSDKGELNHLPLDNNPPFEPFAKELLDRKINCTIISESPITWKDSLKMKKIFEKLGYKFNRL
ncbi:MAG: TIM barrel protein [Candidatus Aenigmarchaeota archaeon]|nr:TIM barrel protein [Candidatus Aenigmarchaeota archaeon]